MSKECIRHCLNTLERWCDPKTGKIDGKGMMEHIAELEAINDALLEALHEIAAATDGADAHLMVWVADKAEAAIAKARGGEE